MNENKTQTHKHYCTVLNFHYEANDYRIKSNCTLKDFNITAYHCKHQYFIKIKTNT